MTFEQVDEIGQGRVWTGAEALKIGLVDKVTTKESLLNAAMDFALQLAKKPLEREDKREFMEKLLESNPLFISGSENATIHGNYISNILRNLDLLTGENIMENKDFRDWYKNDLQFETAVLKWKAHIK